MNSDTSVTSTHGPPAELRAGVLVIGAGVVGAAIAYELAKQGMDVLIVDAGSRSGNGCSYANAGLLAPGHVEPLTTPANVRMGLKHLFQPDGPFHVRLTGKTVPWLARFALNSGPRRARRLTALMQELARQSLAIHREYADDGLRTGFRESGSLDVFLTSKRFAAARHVAEKDPHAQVLTPDQARQRVPGLAAAAGAVLHREDAVCNTLDFVAATLRAAQQLGARLQWNTAVSELTGHDQATGAITNRGTIVADRVVVAAGLSSETLTARFGIKLTLIGGKGYVIDVSAQYKPTLPVTFKELKVVATPYPDRLRFCGTMDLGDSGPDVVERRVRAVQAAAARGLPEVDTSQPMQVWAGQRPCTADGIPAIGGVTKVPNLYIAAGHGMWGLILAPVTGRAIAHEVVKGSPDSRVALFTPDRFTRRRSVLSRRPAPAGARHSCPWP